MLKLQIELNKQIAKSIVDFIQYAKLEGKETTGDGMAPHNVRMSSVDWCGANG